MIARFLHAYFILPQTCKKYYSHYNYIGILLFLPSLWKMCSVRKSWSFGDHACLFSHEQDDGPQHHWQYINESDFCGVLPRREADFQETGAPQEQVSNAQIRGSPSSFCICNFQDLMHKTASSYVYRTK